MECYKCKSSPLLDVEAVESVEVDGHTFTGAVAAKQCATCGEVLLDGAALIQFGQQVAAHLAEAGASSGEAVRYMRKALGLRAVDLAELIDVAPETISRWETGTRAPDRGALALLGALVMDALEGRTVTRDRLRALKTPRKLPKLVRLGRSAA